MKLYDCRNAPNARRVRIFLAEKGINIPLVEVDIVKGENLLPEYRAKNPRGLVPLLELDDGSYIDETVANDYIAGPDFSIADITALCAIDFAKLAKITIPEQHQHTWKWYERVACRPSMNC